ncbi:MAG: hypothetical protein KC591_10415 [Gemmatimonadetes bacterium]|nr:hypothetical protein [Gemmatimonadota bacterium]
MIRGAAVAAACSVLVAAGSATAASLSDVTAKDTPNDGGRSVTVTWETSADTPADASVRLERVDASGVVTEIAVVPASQAHVVDGSSGQEGPPDRTPVSYQVTLEDASGASLAVVSTDPIMALPQFFHRGRLNVLVMLGVFTGLLFYNIWRANQGTSHFYIRRLAPVDAMDEAIGRATEMGRPVLYVPGIEEVQDIQTIAAMLILERVAEKTANYEVPLTVPTRTPFVLAVADEVVRTGCTAAGRPDAYRPDGIRYISNEQFAYCAGVNGIILRDRPAANFYLGRFFAESLIFAETGFAAGSIQIAGTAEVTQLPFFIAACDYTLIGEEFFAASAYLSRDPSLLSTLRAADWAKVILVLALLTGAVLESLGMSAFRDWFSVAG